LFAGRTDAASVGPKLVRVAVVASGGAHRVGTGLVSVADARGAFVREFARDGIRVQLVPFAGGPAINEALAQHGVEIGEYGALPVLIGLAGGVPIRLIATARVGNPWYIAVTRQSSVTTAAELRSRRVAVPLGTLPHQILISLLAMNGLKPGDVRLVNLAMPEATAALAAGAVDAIFMNSPVLALRDKGQVRIIATTASLPGQDYDTAGVVVDRTFERQNPDFVARFVRVLVETSAWSAQSANRQTLLSYYARTGLPIDLYRRETAGRDRAHYSPLIDRSVLAGYRQSVDFAMANRLIRHPPNFTGWIAPQYVNAAIRSLNLEGYWQPRAPLTAVKPRS
jgi:sulfonate transport system substrate-binding protein